jgi:UPF0755 protein
MNGEEKAASHKPQASRARKRLIRRTGALIVLIFIILTIIISVRLYNNVVRPNVRTPDREPFSIYIHTGSTFSDVKKMLYSKGLIINKRSFEWVAGRKNYPALVKPGHYILKNGMNNNDLVNMLRSGKQIPVNVTFNNVRKIEDLAGKVSRQIETDSVSLLKCWNDRAFLKTIGTTPEKVFMMFIPNTYEFWWTTDAYQFTTRMHTEYIKFWNEDRKMKAASARLSADDVSILASIVEKETNKNDEKPMIAGIYINRLHKDWPLQADPTVVYAVGDFDMKRVLTVHTQIDSPYNTYKFSGLPPGPICMPSVSSIDAVLNYKKHDYMFFCAKADLSGYHMFSRTLAEHNRNAKAYQMALNHLKIQ